MFGTWKKFLIVLVSTIWSQNALAQIAPVTILRVQVENCVTYLSDTFDASKFATDPNFTTVPAPGVRNFGMTLTICDIAAVNDRPAKGTAIINSRTLNLSTSPTPGQAVADTARASISNYALEILHPDGAPIGNIYVSGLSGGSAPLGAPLVVTTSNNAVVGGTGAFLGVRGQLGAGGAAAPVPIRTASIAEDPANRRTHGGGRFQIVVHLIPLSRPEILTTSSGPAVAHSNDFSPVTASRPARPGEILSLFATGLGPTRPGVDPGMPFPANPLAVVSSPVEVAVNGRPAEVIGAVGYPGAVDAYQVNFRIPADTARGVATAQLSAAWITGPEVRIAVQ